MRESIAGRSERGFGPADPVEQRREIGVAECDALDAAQALRDRHPLAERGDPLVHVPGHGLGPAQHAEGERFLRVGRGDLGHADGLAREVGGAARVAAEQPQPGGLGQDPGALDRRRFGRDQAQCFVDRSLGCGAIPGLPQVPAQPLVQGAETVCVGGRVGMPGGAHGLRFVDGRATELDRPLVRSGEHGALGGALHHLDPVERTLVGCLGLALPQLQGAFVVAPGLRERIHLLGGGTGRGQRRNRARRRRAPRPSGRRARPG